jgi:hypothetical protein
MKYSGRSTTPSVNGESERRAQYYVRPRVLVQLHVNDRKAEFSGRCKPAIVHGLLRPAPALRGRPTNGRFVLKRPLFIAGLIRRNRADPSGRSTYTPSRNSISNLDRSTVFCPTWSGRCPGVAMRMSTPRRSLSICRCCPRRRRPRWTSAADGDRRSRRSRRPALRRCRKTTLKSDLSSRDP